MTWNSKKKPQIAKRKASDFFVKGEALVHEQGLKMLVWGDAEAGKTHFACSCPEPVYIYP